MLTVLVMWYVMVKVVVWCGGVQGYVVVNGWRDRREAVNVVVVVDVVAEMES